MIKKLLFAMAILGMTTGCKSQLTTGGSSTISPTQTEEPKPKPAMPTGRLLLLTYKYSGMAMFMFDDFELSRSKEDSIPRLTFRYRGDRRTYEVSDTLFDAARRIMEEEKMYEYDSYYSFGSEEKILDGYKWDFFAYFEGKERVSSGGSNLEPDDDTGLKRINQLLTNAAKACVEASEKQEEQQ